MNSFEKILVSGVVALSLGNTAMKEGKAQDLRSTLQEPFNEHVCKLFDEKDSIPKRLSSQWILFPYRYNNKYLEIFIRKIGEAKVELRVHVNCSTRSTTSVSGIDSIYTTIGSILDKELGQRRPNAREKAMKAVNIVNTNPQIISVGGNKVTIFKDNNTFNKSLFGVISEKKLKGKDERGVIFVDAYTAISLYIELEKLGLGKLTDQEREEIFQKLKSEDGFSYSSSVFLSQYDNEEEKNMIGRDIKKIRNANDLEKFIERYHGRYICNREYIEILPGINDLLIEYLKKNKINIGFPVTKVGLKDFSLKRLENNEESCYHGG